MGVFSLKNSKFLFFISIFIHLCSLLSAQNPTSKQIDSLFKAAQIERKKGNLQEYRKKNLSNLQESQKINYSKGIALSHYGAGTASRELGNYAEAIEHFTYSEKEPYTKNDLSLQSETNRYLGECYYNLGLYDKAIAKHNKAIRIAELAKDINIYIRKALNYNDIAASLEKMEGSGNSAYSYYTKALYYINQSPDSSKVYAKEEKYGLAALIASNLGTICDSRNNADSANYYFQKALELNKVTRNKGMNAIIYNQMGDSFLKNKKYDKAIVYYKKTIQLSSKIGDLYRPRNGYKGIAEAYKNSGNEKKYLEYIQLYIKANDSIAALEKKGTDKSVNKIINEEKTVYEKSETKLYWIISGILLSAILIFLTAYLLHQKIKKKKELEIIEKDKIIIKQVEEAQELSMKLNTSFDEVVQLAKTNNPEFFTRFQEVYPEFSNKLLAINSNLVNSELRFCALLFLNFSTKDIAEFTFTSPKTVQNRKNSIRKKLNILSEEDLYIWFKNLNG